jgi:cyclase
MRIKNLKWLAVLLLLAAVTPAKAGDLFEIKPVVPGVWAAIAKPHKPDNANSAFVELTDSVLVVDAGSTPSSARALIAEIRRLTDKPVRYLLDGKVQSPIRQNISRRASGQRRSGLPFRERQTE